MNLYNKHVNKGTNNVLRRKVGIRVKLIALFLVQTSLAFHVTIPRTGSAFLCSKCLTHQFQRISTVQTDNFHNNISRQDVVLDELDEYSIETERNSLSIDPYIEMKKINRKALSSVLHVPTEICLNQFQRPTIIGHRGATYEEPENTIRGFEVAAEIGCEAVELDVFLLKCGTLIVFHGGGPDEDPGQLLDYCGIDANILDYTAEEARKLTFSPLCEEYACPKYKLSTENAFIPTLKEVLEAAELSDWTLKLELKGPGTAEPVLNLVEKMCMVDQCHFSSFDHDRIARIRQLRPEKNLDGTHKYRTGALFKDDLPNNFVELALKAGASEVHLKYDTCTKERIEAIHANGMGSMAWFRGTVGMKEDVIEKYYDVGNEDELMYLTLISTGVQSLCVNRPNVLSKLLDKLEGLKQLDHDVIMNIAFAPLQDFHDKSFHAQENRTEFLSLVA